MQSKSGFKYFLAITSVCGLMISSGFMLKNSREPVQIDVGNLLNARPITTLTNGKLVHWTKGVDRENGFLTTAAAKFNGEANPKAIPDNPLIPADSHHPAILLHYNNTNGKGFQAMLLDTNATNIAIPKGKYKDLYICLTSAYGKSKLEYELIYNDGTEVKTVTIPDWANDVPDNDPDFSYVVHDLAKWSNTASRTEPNHHNIHALNVHPNPTRFLKSIKIKNLSKTYMLFWAATGVGV